MQVVVEVDPILALLVEMEDQVVEVQVHLMVELLQQEQLIQVVEVVEDQDQMVRQVEDVEQQVVQEL
tara:strand:+ start:336 stop:536 length:201 start_codon:yes stop_codon:yes gene_type:complete